LLPAEWHAREDARPSCAAAGQAAGRGWGRGAASGRTRPRKRRGTGGQRRSKRRRRWWWRKGGAAGAGAGSNSHARPPFCLSRMPPAMCANFAKPDGFMPPSVGSAATAAATAPARMLPLATAGIASSANIPRGLRVTVGLSATGTGAPSQCASVPAAPTLFPSRCPKKIEKKK